MLLRPARKRLYFLSLCLLLPQFSRGQTAAQHFDRAGELMKERKFSGAIQEYRLGLRINPKSVPSYNNLGVAYFQEGDFSQAAQAFGEAHRLVPSDPGISFNLGLALFKSGNCGSAVSPLTVAFGSSIHATDARYLAGVCYFELKRWKASIYNLEIARKARPSDEKILYVLFNDYRQVKKLGKSMEIAKLLFKGHPDSLFAYQLLGKAYDASGEYLQAEHEFKNAIKVSPKAPELHFLLGYLYWKRMRYQKAIVPFEKEIVLNPNFAPPYYYLGDIALRQQRNRQALAYFKRALRIDPSYGKADLGIGQAYAQLGQYEDAVNFLRQAIERMPNEVVPHYWLGRILIRMGRTEDGRKEFSEVNRINAEIRARATEHLKHANHPEQVKRGPLRRAAPKKGGHHN